MPSVPPDWCTKPCTCDSPRPVPLSGGFVVKNGSNTRGRRSGAMPLPVSATVIATKSPLRPSRVSAGCSVAFSAESVIMPPSGMASRALSARLMSASSNSARSTRTGHSSGGTSAASRTCAPIELAMQRPHRLEALADAGDNRGQHLAARERQQLPGQRFAAPRRELDRLRGAHALLIVGDELLQRVDVPADDHQEVVEVVRDAAGELAQRLHLLGLGALRLRRLEGELGLATLGDVAGDLGKADEAAVVVE